MFLQTIKNETKKRLRITEEFSNLLVFAKRVYPAAGENPEYSMPINITTETVSVYYERAGRNIQIANRLPLAVLLSFSNVIENESIVTKKNLGTMINLSMFEGGNCKLSENDAIIVEFDSLKDADGMEYDLFLTPDLETCNGIYQFERKTILAGETTKTFNLLPYERILLTQDGSHEGIEAISLFVEDENGKMTERKFDLKELFYSSIFQVDTSHQFTKAIEENGVMKELSQFIPLVIEGVSQIKFYMRNDTETTYPFYLQNTLKIGDNGNVSDERLNVGYVSPDAQFKSGVDTLRTARRI